MAAFGFAEQAEIIPSKLGKHDVLFLGKTPYRIDILSGVSALQFAKAYRRKNIHDMESTLVPYLSLSDLIENKEASGRNKDMADVEVLRQLPARKP